MNIIKRSLAAALLLSALTQAADGQPRREDLYSASVLYQKRVALEKDLRERITGRNMSLPPVIHTVAALPIPPATPFVDLDAAPGTPLAFSASASDPEGDPLGIYLRSLTVSTTMGPGVPVDAQAVANLFKKAV